MRITLLLSSLAVSLLTPNAFALQFAKREGVLAVVPLTIHRREVNNLSERLRLDRIRRRQTVSEVLANFEQGNLYFANCTVGTPPQDFRLQIDTGSSDMWMNTETSKLCKQGNHINPDSGDIPCSVSGTYNANASSTYKYIDSDFSIQYDDNSTASGDYAEDVMKIGGKTVNPMQFGIGYISNSSEGVLGIGYPSNEAQVSPGNQAAYPNLPVAMTNQGLIQSPAYSLWLDDLDSSTRSILFGGVDTEKYIGELTTLPIIQEDGVYVDMLIAMSGVTLVSNGTNTTVLKQSTSVVLDSGSTFSYLPISMTDEIYRVLGVVFSENYELPLCSCSLANTSVTIDFEFSGQGISVPINEMVLEGEVPNSADCSFGIISQPNDGIGSYVLGDTFLRSAYVVYDIGNNEISIAPTNFSPSGSNILAIGTGDKAIPTASGVQNPPTVTATSLNPSATTAGAKSSAHAMSVVPKTVHASAWALILGAAYIFSFW